MKNFMEVVALFFGVIKTIQLAKADGEINHKDIMLMPDLLFKVGPALEDANKINMKWLLDAQKRSDFKAFIVKEFDITDDAAEAVIEELAACLVDVAGGLTKATQLIAKLTQGKPEIEA